METQKIPRKKKIPKSQSNLKKNGAGRIRLPDYKATVIKTV